MKICGADSGLLARNKQFTNKSRKLVKNNLDISKLILEYIFIISDNNAIGGRIKLVKSYQPTFHFLIQKKK